VRHSTGIDLDAALARFGHGSFRPGQREAIETLLEARRLLLVAPTGGGKSLSYQLPASFLPGTTLVVSPLIALMHDQVTALERRGIAATYLASTLDPLESRERVRGIASGAYALVYVAPERLAVPGFRSLVADLECPLLAVDEAHCISEWGHDFRPDYLEIGGLVAALPGSLVLACTATATPVVRDEILERLGLPSDTPQRLHGFARPNLSLRAREVHGRGEREAAVDGALAEALGNPGAARGTAIVYALTRKNAEEEAKRLEDRGWRSCCYHAGLRADLRGAAQRSFDSGEIDVVVATNAFGMGIDRPDVRAVVHLGPPSSIEAYYQEVGRAGRDGEPALGLMLHALADFRLRRLFVEGSAGDSAPTAEVVEHKWNLFLELMRWADGGSCRHDAVLRYFGDEDETLAGCGICDVCTRLVGEADQDPERATLIARKALSGVARVDGRFGMGAAIQLLRGGADERLTRAGLDLVPTFGVLKEHSEDWHRRLMRRLVTAGWVAFEGGERPVVVLTDTGRRVMRAELPARILLPPEKRPRSAPGRSPSRRGAARSAADADLDAGGRERFEALRRWRLVVARSGGVPPYVVASDRTLRDVALMQPRNHEELLLCHGIGPAKAERYGAEIVELLRSSGGAPSPGVA
jgi:ATP-dependent DNA helicase RecQ